MNTKPLRVGIIGANWGVHTHLPAWRSLDGVEVVAICTSRPETAQDAASKYQIPYAFSDYRELAASNLVDIIDVGARPATRADMVNEALKNRKHVVAGMPFAISYEEAKSMANNQSLAGVVGAVDALSASNPPMRYMQDLILDGYLGEIYGFRANVSFSLVTKRHNNAGAYAEWYSRAGTGASSLRTQGAHILHPLVGALGPVESVISDNAIRLKEWPNQNGTTIRAENPDTSFSLLRFDNGVTGSLSCSWSVVGAEGTNIEIWGSERRLVVSSSFLPQSTDVRLLVSEDTVSGAPQHELSVPDEYLEIARSSPLNSSAPSPLVSVQHLLASVRDEILGSNGRHAAPGFDQALHVQGIIEAAERSHDERRWVSLDEL